MQKTISSMALKADDAIRNKVDQLMSNPKSASPQINFSVGSSKLENDIENGRQSIESMLISWNSSITGMSNAQDVLPYAVEARNNLKIVQSYMDNVALAVNSLQSNTTLSQATVDAYRAAVLAGRTNVTSRSEEHTSELQSQFHL